MYLAMILERAFQAEALSRAMSLIDPGDTLRPGSREYANVRHLVRDWIDQCGSEQALFMARIGARHLDRWRKFL